MLDYLETDMIYNPGNVHPGTSVYDVDTKEKIGSVVEVDTESGELTCFHKPARLNPARDGLETFKIKFRQIYPIFGGSARPCLFHCYGRLAMAGGARVPHNYG